MKINFPSNALQAAHVVIELDGLLELCRIVSFQIAPTCVILEGAADARAFRWFGITVRKKPDDTILPRHGPINKWVSIPNVLYF